MGEYKSIFWKMDMARFMRNHDSYIGPKSCQVPGSRGDNDTHRCFEKFEKWYNLPTAAQVLYWRLHDYN